MLLNCAENLVKLILIILSHILEVVLKSASVISHSLYFEFDLSVDSDSLLVRNHLLMNLMPEI